MKPSGLCVAALLVCAASAAVQVQTGSVAAPDGVRIVYDVRGRGNTTLLFIHCWSCDRSFWSNQADAFADRYQVVTMDLAGHGESGKDRKKWTILGLAGDVRAVADKLDLKRIILVGHSMGGPVALEAARLLHGRVIGIITVDTIHNVEQPVPAEMAQTIAKKLKADFPGTMGSFMGGMFAPGSSPAVRAWVERKAKAANPAVAAALLLDFPNLDFRKMFAAAGAPIRAINANPPASPVTAVDINRKYANYEAALIENSGHFIQLERPQVFNAQLARFAASLSKPAAK